MVGRHSIRTFLVASSALCTAPGVSLAQTGFEEIIVTAQRREASLQATPVTVSAFSETQLQDLAIVETKDLGQAVPNLQLLPLTASPSTFQVGFRGGTEQTGGLIVSEPVVGIYVDDVYRSRLQGANFQLADIERIEVLRGPQGTLYGRNTFAGALNLTTNKPELGDYSAGIEVGYERFDTFRGEGFINIPLGDTVAIRGAGYVTKGDGYIENLAGPDIGQQDDKGLRVSLLWEPTDNFDLIARIQHTEEDGREAGLFGYTFLCRGVTPSGHTDAFGSEQDCANPNRGAAPSNFAANSGQPNTGPYTIEQDYVPDVDLKETVLSLEMNLDLGSVSVKSITSYRSEERRVGKECRSRWSPYH